VEEAECCDDADFDDMDVLTCTASMDVDAEMGVVLVDTHLDAAAATREKSSSVYLSIISQQTFIGCWKLNTELSSLLDVSLDKLQNSAPVKVSFIYGLWCPVKSF